MRPVKPKRDRLLALAGPVVGYVALLVVLIVCICLRIAGKISTENFLAGVCISVLFLSLPTYWFLKAIHLLATGHGWVGLIFPDHDYVEEGKEFVGTVQGVTPPYDAEYKYTFVCKKCGAKKTGYGY